MKNGRKDTFWAFSGDVYRYTLNMYRYTLCSGHFGQCVPVHIRGVPYTCSAFPISISFRIFGHNLLISYPI